MSSLDVYLPTPAPSRSTTPGPSTPPSGSNFLSASLPIEPQTPPKELPSSPLDSNTIQQVSESIQTPEQHVILQGSQTVQPENTQHQDLEIAQPQGSETVQPETTQARNPETIQPQDPENDLPSSSEIILPAGPETILPPGLEIFQHHESETTPPRNPDTVQPQGAETILPPGPETIVPPGPETIVPPGPETDQPQDPETDTLEIPEPLPEPEPVYPPRIPENTGVKPLKLKPSPAELEWERQKEEEGCENPAIDQLMRLVGLEDVKDQVLAIHSKVEVCKCQDTNLKKERFNIVFQGNPGTGKTTVARMYAQFLKSSGVLDTGVVYETSGAKLSYQGPFGIEQIIEQMLKSGGGVLFVDEAYQLTAPHATNGGRQALDIILTEMENNIGKLIVVFAGYNKEMQTIFEHNPGLASRVPYTLQFEDFDDVELWRIMSDSIDRKYKGKMEVEGGFGGLYMRVAIRRLARGRGVRNFGNARSVHNLLAKISERQAKRLTWEKKNNLTPNYFKFTKEDIIGPKPADATLKSKAWARLNQLIGLDEVKATAKCMIEMIMTNYNRELAEVNPIEFSLNRVFYGSPGTGKTTVAKLYGQIMADLGLLSNGEVIIKNPSDFIGECLGKSEAKTRAILGATIGKVLIIDEAYMLNSGGTGNQSDSFKMAVIDTLVAEVQSVPGDDRCILILGYEDKLKEMFQNVNPGLSRRFAIDDPFRFQDFNLPQLKQILQLKMREQEVTATDEALRIAHDILDRARMRPNFCNAGEVDNCLAKASINYQARQLRKNVDDRDFNAEFRPEDFDPNFDRNIRAIESCKDLLQGTVDEDIIKKLVSFQEFAIKAKAQGLDLSDQIPINFVFKGPPGTGKTTTAKNMGKVYYDMGFLSTSEVIECSASDLIGQFVGHTSPKTRNQLERALGKVLLVDEAYRLTEGQYATEAVNELIHLLGTKKYLGKMVVILAGYTHDMNKLMASRPALSGLFSEEIIFKNIKPADCLSILDRELKLKSISAPFLAKPDGPTLGSVITPYQKMLRLIKMLSIFPSWSNARDIQTLAREMSRCATAQIPPGEFRSKISEDETVNCMKRMINMKYERCRTQEGQAGKRLNLNEFTPGPTTANSEASVFNANAELSSAPAAAATDSQGTDPTAAASPAAASQVAAPPPRIAQEDPPSTLNQPGSPPQPPPAAICRRPESDADSRRGAGVPDVVWDEMEASRRAKKLARDTVESDLERLRGAVEDLKAQEIENAEEARNVSKEKPLDMDDTERIKIRKRIKATRLEAERLQRLRELEEEALKKKQQELEEMIRKEKEMQEKLLKIQEQQAEEEIARLKEEERKLEEQGKKDEELQRKLQRAVERKSGVCGFGYPWVEVEGGYRCDAGVCFISNAEFQNA